MRNVGHNKDVGKGLTEAKVEIEQALAIGFVASSIESLKGEATVGPLAICVCGGNGADVGTRVDQRSRGSGIAWRFPQRSGGTSID